VTFVFVSAPTHTAAVTTHAAAAAAAAHRRQESPPLLSPSPAPVALPSDGKYPDDPPAVPLCGSANASIGDLLAWHAEIQAAKCERIAASTHLEAADRRYRFAWNQYIKLYTFAISDRSPLPSEGQERDSSGAAEDEGDGMNEDTAAYVVCELRAGEDVRVFGGMDLS